MRKNLLQLVLPMVCMALALPAWAFESNGLNYKVLSETDKTVEVGASSNFSYAGDITVPATVTNNGVEYTVTSVGGGAFQKCTEVTSVTLPKTVKSIGGSAFYFDEGQSKLTSVVIPEDSELETIGKMAFKDCCITKLYIPSTVTSMEDKWKCDRRGTRIVQH